MPSLVCVYISLSFVLWYCDSVPIGEECALSCRAVSLMGILKMTWFWVFYIGTYSFHTLLIVWINEISTVIIECVRLYYILPAWHNLTTQLQAQSYAQECSRHKSCRHSWNRKHRSLQRCFTSKERNYPYTTRFSTFNNFYLILMYPQQHTDYCKKMKLILEIINAS